MKRTCAVLVISGRTTHIREDLKRRGFKWNENRKSWAKFADVEKLEALRIEGAEIAMKYLGNVLLDVFVSNEDSFKS